MPKALEGCSFFETSIISTLYLSSLAHYSSMYWFLEHPIFSGLHAAVLFEVITITFRFGFKMTSPTHMRPLAKLTSGYRVHHGYPGVGMLMVLPVVPTPTIVGTILIMLGLMLFVSDLFHHALIPRSSQGITSLISNTHLQVISTEDDILTRIFFKWSIRSSILRTLRRQFSRCVLESEIYQ